MLGFAETVHMLTIDRTVSEGVKEQFRIRLLSQPLGQGLSPSLFRRVVWHSSPHLPPPPFAIILSGWKIVWFLWAMLQRSRIKINGLEEVIWKCHMNNLLDFLFHSPPIVTCFYKQVASGSRLLHVSKGYVIKTKKILPWIFKCKFHYLVYSIPERCNDSSPVSRANNLLQHWISPSTDKGEFGTNSINLLQKHEEHTFKFLLLSLT